MAARNLIADSVNGLFFLLEDQFALDDIIVVENLGVGGVVENMTLRITQLRDVKGRLISIPNGQIAAVSNYTYLWCRADLKIPVPYDVDIDKAMDTVLKVAEEMKKDEGWSDIIIEDPNLLGVDEFNEWRAIIRLWIKVKPMKLWSVSREYRRRLMIAFEEANINLPIPEHKVHFQKHLPLDFSDKILNQLQSPKTSENSSNKNYQKSAGQEDREYAIKNNKDGYGASGEET
ncbi:MAG: mechanosensitive ion channel family protein [Prochloraceae cyanobacterium]